MPEHTVWLQLLVLYLGALALGSLFSRLRWPAASGHLLAGLILGPLLLEFTGALPPVLHLADLAVVFLLFQLGLDTNPEPMLERPNTAFAVAGGGFVLSLVLGYGAGRLMGGDFAAAAALGLVLAMSVSAVRPAALENLTIYQNRTGHLVQGAAAAGHYLSLAALSVLVVATGAGGPPSPETVLVWAAAVVPFALAWLLSRFLSTALAMKAAAHADLALLLGLGMIILLTGSARLTQTPVMTAAFLAGQVMRLEGANRKILAAVQHRVKTVAAGFLAPLFFGTLGALAAFSGTREFWLPTALLLVASLAGKAVGGGLTALACRRPMADAVATGTAMAGNGPAPLAAAAAVLAINPASAAVGAHPLIGPEMLAAAVAALLTASLIAPALLGQVVRRAALDSEQAAFESALDAGMPPSLRPKRRKNRSLQP